MKLGIGAVALLALVSTSVACVSGDRDGSRNGDRGGFDVPAYSPPVPSAPVADGSVGDGTHQVGRDIAAGRWETVVPDTARGCYYARKRDLTGDVAKDVITTGNLAKGARGILDIPATDKFVEFSGGCRWRQPGAAPVAPSSVAGSA